MIRLSSYQRDYDIYWSGDPALEQPPIDPGRAVSDETIAAFKAALAAYQTKLTAARETSDWSALILENQVPLKFVMQQVDRNIWRAIIDRGSLPLDNPRLIGPGVLSSLLFRLAVKDIPGGEIKVVRAPAPEWDGWVMAQADIVSALDFVNPAIVSELGMDVYRRLVGVPKKS